VAGREKGGRAMTKELKTRKTIVRQNMKTAHIFTCRSNDDNKYTHVFS